MGIASGTTNPESTNYTTSVGWQTNHDSDEGVPPPQYLPLHNGPYLILVLFTVIILLEVILSRSSLSGR